MELMVLLGIIDLACICFLVYIFLIPRGKKWFKSF